MVPLMPSWGGPLFAAATLLILAAVPKIRYPDDTARALRSTGLPGMSDSGQCRLPVPGLCGRRQGRPAGHSHGHRIAS